MMIFDLSITLFRRNLADATEFCGSHKAFFAEVDA
jgi:hypothetical protein